MQVWTLQEGGVSGVRAAAGTAAGLTMSNKAVPLNEHKGSTIVAIAADESGTLLVTILIMIACSH